MPKVFGSIDEITLLGYLIRTLIVGFIGFIVGRIISKRAVNQLTTYDFALIWILGAITVSPLLDGKISFTYMLVPLFTLFFWHTLFSIISLKNRRFSSFFNGKPAILIDNGKVVTKNLKKHFINTDLLLSELRVKNIFNIAEVKYAILEPNGQISIMKYEPHSPVTPKDMKLHTKPIEIPLIIISEGNLIQENLQKLGLDYDWVINNLAIHNVNDIKEVFLATSDSSKNINIIKND